MEPADNLFPAKGVVNSSINDVLRRLGEQHFGGFENGY
jgi:hypothetical protein